MVKKKVAAAPSALRWRRCLPLRCPFSLAPLLLFLIVFALWLGRRIGVPALQQLSVRALPPAPAAAVDAPAAASPQLRGAGLPSLFSGNTFNPARVPGRLEKVDKDISTAGLREACKKKGMSRWILCREIGFKYIPGDEA
jgi:hypothetical protein